VAHLLAVDLDDAADRTEKTEPRALRHTWIIGWREARRLAFAYIAMTAVFTAAGLLAFGDDRRWWLVDVDERIARWFAAQRTDPLDMATLIGSWLSETITKIAVTAVVVVILLRWLRRWYEALVVAISLILEAMVFISTTWFVGRARPSVPRLDDSPVSSSFPSGHVAAAACYAAIAIVAGRNGARRWVVATLWTFAVLTPIVVAVSRMYRGMHFMSDVVVGVFLGVVSVGVTLVILTPAERARRARSLPSERAANNPVVPVAGGIP
jgi:undecaprenyl-diphosphatase